jgi:hypothetical protein
MTKQIQKNKIINTIDSLSAIYLPLYEKHEKNPFI